jgi:hypothetical protein
MKTGQLYLMTIAALAFGFAARLLLNVYYFKIAQYQCYPYNKIDIVIALVFCLVFPRVAANYKPRFSGAAGGAIVAFALGASIIDWSQNHLVPCFPI